MFYALEESILENTNDRKRSAEVPNVATTDLQWANCPIFTLGTNATIICPRVEGGWIL